MSNEEVTNTYCKVGAQPYCHRIIAESPAPIETRRVYAMRILQDQRKSAAFGGPIRKLLDASMFPALRALVRESTDPNKFHFAASSVLAHYGDLEIVATLENARPALRAVHVNSEGIVILHLWKIAVQNPPSELLAYIASPPEIGVERRLWAIRRADEVGFPKSEIREAILSHATLIQPDGNGIRHGLLSSIKRVGLELAILRASDLPGIVVPPQLPMP